MSETSNAPADPFAAPAEGGALSSLKGNLLLITPKTVGKTKSKYPTKDGTGFVEHIACDIVVLTDVNGGTTPRVMSQKIVSASMLQQIMPYVPTNQMVLGTLDQKQFDIGQPGWVLNEATEDEKVIAREYLANKPPAPVKADPFATT